MAKLTLQKSLNSHKTFTKGQKNSSQALEKRNGQVWEGHNSSITLLKDANFCDISIAIVGYNLQPLDSHALHILYFLEHPTGGGHHSLPTRDQDRTTCNTLSV